jgi:outer membrane protein OmpA-like peptidoglycan-associated protein
METRKTPLGRAESLALKRKTSPTIYQLFFSLLLSQGIYFSAKAQAPAATDNIIITKNSAIINGLTSIAPVETTMSAFMGKQENLAKKAELELKKQAVSKGGNIVFVTTDDFINDPNSYIKKVHMVGVLYKQDASAANANNAANTQTGSPSKNGSDSTKNIIKGVDLSITACVGDPNAQTVTLYFTFTNTTNISQKITLHGGAKSTGVTAVGVPPSTIFDDNGSQYECKDDFWLLSDKELPSQLKLKGMIVFSNVLPSAKMIALAKLSVGIADWDGGGNGKRGVLQFKNLKINWNGIVPADNSGSSNKSWVTKIKNLNNGIDFEVTDCKGDSKAQTVALFFTFSNPRKTNQKISVQNGFYSNPAMAFDDAGNQYPFKGVSLAGVNANNQIEKELVTNLTLKGSITYSNVLPTVDGFAMVKIPVVSSNWDGGENMVNGMIEVTNIAIHWNNRPKGSVTASLSGYSTYDQLTAKLNQGEKATGIKIILNNISFEPGDATMTQTSKSHLGNLMLLLQKYPTIKVKFTGNTDNVGRDDDNLILSATRAKSIVDYLVGKGISRDRLSYQGLGSSKPIADNSSEEGRAKNRRIEMEIISQ